MKKHNIGWEDDDCWITENYTNYNGGKDMALPDEREMDFSSLESYTHISKRDFSSRKMTIAEFKDWKKSHNKK